MCAVHVGNRRPTRTHIPSAGQVAGEEDSELAAPQQRAPPPTMRLGFDGVMAGWKRRSVQAYRYVCERNCEHNLPY